MHMQDKDLDQLFRFKLEELEAEPSARVWAGISKELDEPKRPDSLVVLLRIAATVVMLICAGLFLLPKQQAKLHKLKNKVAINLPVKKQHNITAINKISQVNTVAQVRRTNTAKLPKASIAAHHTTWQATPLIAEQPVKTDPAKNQQVLAAVETNHISKPVVPDKDVPLANKTLVAVIAVKPVLPLAAATDKETNQTPVKKRKIHGLGGFINAVVGVIDKREDKIIEFTDIDEGNTVTGINLGIITVKKNQ